MRLTYACRLALLTPALLACAQETRVSDDAIADAFRALTRGPGGCVEDPRRVDAPSTFFPTLRVIRGLCVAEHGDSVAVSVGIDRDNLIHLLASRSAFDFLVTRIPPIALDSTTVVAYALTALEYSGTASIGAHVVAPDDLHADARTGITLGKGRLTQVNALGPRWRVALVTVGRGGQYRPAVYRHELLIAADGKLDMVHSEILWSDPAHP